MLLSRSGASPVLLGSLLVLALVVGIALGVGLAPRGGGGEEPGSPSHVDPAGAGESPSGRSSP